MERSIKAKIKKKKMGLDFNKLTMHSDAEIVRKLQRDM
jgi:hypothetical protein